ncbi:MAG TPA: hypothetical protein VGI99_14165 [Gemmataceae bacterium]
MQLDIDENPGGDSYIYQLSDDRFLLVVRVAKGRLAEFCRAARSLAVGEKVVLGSISCGERVWLARGEPGYALAIGDTDSADVSIALAEPDFLQLLEACN